MVKEILNKFTAYLLSITTQCSLTCESPHINEQVNNIVKNLCFLTESSWPLQSSYIPHQILCLYISTIASVVKALTDRHTQGITQPFVLPWLIVEEGKIDQFFKYCVTVVVCFRFHALHQEKIPDLRENHRTSKKYNFKGMHGAATYRNQCTGIPVDAMMNEKLPSLLDYHGQCSAPLESYCPILKPDLSPTKQQCFDPGERVTRWNECFVVKPTSDARIFACNSWVGHCCVTMVQQNKLCGPKH